MGNLKSLLDKFQENFISFILLGHSLCETSLQSYGIVLKSTKTLLNLYLYESMMIEL